MSATECSECSVNVVCSYCLDIILSLCFSVKALKTIGKQYCNGLRRHELKLCIASCLLYGLLNTESTHFFFNFKQRTKSCHNLPVYGVSMTSLGPQNKAKKRSVIRLQKRVSRRLLTKRYLLPTVGSCWINESD